MESRGTISRGISRPRSSPASRTGASTAAGVCSAQPAHNRQAIPQLLRLFPLCVSYPSILGEIYSATFAAAAFNWICSPATTELETIVLDVCCVAEAVFFPPAPPSPLEMSLVSCADAPGPSGSPSSSACPRRTFQRARRSVAA